VSKPFRVIENGNHLWKHTVNRDFLRFRHWERRIFRVSRLKQIHRFRYFGRIGDWLRLGCHRKARDRHRVRDFMNPEAMAA
jgi:hypothetical protein